jgi:uncharacterized protein (DUF2252 family)
MATQTLPPSSAPTKTEIAAKASYAKRAAIYTRISTVDQHHETQLLDLRLIASQRGYEIVRECVDTISGAKWKRPGQVSSWRVSRRALPQACS